MIHKEKTPDGVRLFTDPLVNNDCQGVADVRFEASGRRTARLSIRNLVKPMTIADATLFVGEFRSLIEEAKKVVAGNGQIATKRPVKKRPNTPKQRGKKKTRKGR